MFARGVLTIEGVMRLCCPKVSFVEIFAKSLALDFKKNFSWHDEMDKVKREASCSCASPHNCRNRSRTSSR